MLPLQFKALILFRTVILICSLMGIAQASEVPVNSLEKTRVKINVGIYAPFSDQYAFIGRNMLAAMEMARDQLKASNIKYSFYTLDELPNTPASIEIVQKFLNTHHINIMITEGAVNGLLVAPIAKKNNIIHFSMASNPAIADGQNNFLAWSPVSEQAAVLVNTLKQKHIMHLSIITTNNASDKILTKNVMERLKADSQIKVVSFEQVQSGAKNYSSLINKIKNKKPELYFIMAEPEEIELMQVAMKAAHLKTPITTIVERVTPKVIKIFDGQWYIDTHEMQPEFIAEYKETNFNYPVAEAGYAFDIFHILNQSVIMSLKVNHKFSSHELAHQIHFLAVGTGVMGPFNLDKNGVLYTKSEVKVIKNGRVLTA